MRIAMLAVLLMVGCYHQSDVMFEKGTIVQTVFSPGQTGTGVGFSTSGNMHVTTYTTDDKYAVVISCQHGTFVVARQDIFNKVRNGDKVIIEYKEIRADSDNSLIKYEFVNLAVAEREGL